MTSPSGPVAGSADSRLTLVICAAAALFEGFDNQSMGVAAPMAFRELGVSPSYAGLIFSAATLGLFLGAAVGGRLADRLGRQRTLMVSLALFGLCSLLSSFVHGAGALFVTRLLTGLGCGGAMPNFIALASEAVDPRRRLNAVVLVMAALPLGGALAGVMAIGDRLGWGWRPIFVVGGTAPIVVALLMLRWHRAASRGSGQPAIGSTDLQGPAIDSVGEVLWGMGRARTTALLWTGFLCTQLILFLMLNWLPSLMIGLGFSRTQASVGSVVFNVAGSGGAVLLGRLHAGEHRGRSVVGTYGGIAAALLGLVAVASAGNSFPVAVLACALAGVFMIGAQLILFALAPLYYRRATRGTGVGAAVAVGRLGSVIGPLFAGALLAAGGGSATVLAGVVPFVLLAGAAALALTRQTQSSD